MPYEVQLGTRIDVSPHGPVTYVTPIVVRRRDRKGDESGGGG